MKKVLMSIHPKWCEKIFNGEKTIEVRKIAPKIDTPFEVLVYCTMPKERWSVGHQIFFNDTLYTLPTGELKIGDALELMADWLGKYDANNFLNGKVIGSFICDRIDEIEPDLEYYSDGYDIDDDRLAETCLTREQLREYGKGVTLYGWHITEPKLFDKPKELSEFGTVCNKYENDECDDCPYLQVCVNSYPCDDSVDTWCGVDNIKPLTRLRRSFVYVEDI